jgi:aspartyl aminopeptidase
MASAAFGSKFCKFVDGAPTPFHCVTQTVRRLEASGFVRVSEEVAWGKAAAGGLVRAGGKYFFTRNGSTLVAFAVGTRFTAGNAFKVVGAHTDSPALKLKPVSKRSASGCLQVNCETYGGGLWHTWFDRDLGIAGRCIVRLADGKLEQRLVHITAPILHIPTLAIHLQSGDERAAFKINNEDHLMPMLGLIDSNLNAPSAGAGTGAGAGAVGASLDARHAPELLRRLAADIKCEPAAIVDLELTLCDTQPANVGGNAGEFIFSPRLDNQMHCFTAIEALAEYVDKSGLEGDEDCSVVALFDHEEVGSQSTTGAGSPVMRDSVQRIGNCFVTPGTSNPEELLQIGLSKSLLISADGAHAVHPNYASKHEKEHSPKLGAGTVIKTNDNQRYATNGVTGFFVRELARRNNLPIQEFCVRNDCPCGTTIGPIVAALTGIRTVDLGTPQLSMHSIRETCAVADLHSNYQLLLAFFKEGRVVDKLLQPLL